MKKRSTILLLIVALGLYAFIHFYASNKPGTREQLIKSQEVTSFHSQDVDRISIESRDSKTVLSRQGSKWEIQQPIQDRADSQLIDHALRVLEHITHYQVIAPEGSGKDKQHQRSEFGLGTPKMRIELQGKKKLPVLLIGRETAVDDRVYAMLEDSDTIYVVDVAVRDVLNHSPDDFRDPQMTDLPPTQVDRVLISTKEGQIELQKDGEDWDLLRPIRARVNTAQLAELVRGATTVRTLKFISSDAENLAPYGLSEPRGTVTLFTLHEEETVSFDIGNMVEEVKNKDGEVTQPAGVYVHYPKRHAVFLLPKEVDHFVTTQPTDLRDKHLTRLNLDVVDRMTLALGGANPIVFARNKEDWGMRKNEQSQAANASKIIDLLTRLQKEEVSAFVADTTSDLARYGLDDPQLRITVSSFSSENVPEAGAGEHPFLHLDFGKTEGDVVYARLEEEPFIVAVRKDFVQTIEVDPILWRALPVFTYDLESIQEIQRTFADTTITIQRTSNGDWITNGDRQINQTAAASLSNTLSRLRAVRWIGDIRESYGFEHPKVQITFKTKQEEHTLRIGEMQDNMYLATLGDGVFLINQPDYESIVAGLSESHSEPDSAK